MSGWKTTDRDGISFVFVKQLAKIGVVTAGVDITATAKGDILIESITIQNDANAAGGATGGVLVVSDDTFALSKSLIAQGSDITGSNQTVVAIDHLLNDGKKLQLKAVTSALSGTGNILVTIKAKRVVSSSALGAA